MCAALGGRAAEEITFGKISTGALSDLEKVTKQAYAMVSIYGLNDVVGNISYYDSRGQSQFTKPYSEDTNRVIDKEVSKLIEEQYQRAKDILTENKDKLDALANKLLEKEVIFKEDLVAIFGERPWDKLSAAEKIKAADKHPEVKVEDAHIIEDDIEKTAPKEDVKSESKEENNSNEDVEKDTKLDSENPSSIN